MHDGRAEASHEPKAERRVGEGVPVVEVLDDREPRSDREPVNGRIHQESDSVGAYEPNEDQRLGRLLDDRGDVTGVRCIRQRKACFEGCVDEPAGRCERAARDQGARHETAPDQFVAVEIDQRQEEQEDRQQSDRYGHCITFREIIASCRVATPLSKAAA